MKLNEVIQQKVELEIEKLDKTLVFNNLTLADQAWLMENYTTEELTNVFIQSKTDDILKIAVRFLDDKSKEYLSKIKIVERDEFGVEKEQRKFTLAEKLFNICTEGEFILLIQKLFEIRNKSTELIRSVSENFQKKTEEETKAKDGK